LIQFGLKPQLLKTHKKGRFLMIRKTNFRTPSTTIPLERDDRRFDRMNRIYGMGWEKGS
jgi:hypothetical protein